MLLLDSLVNNSLIANSKHFYFDYKNGKYGYNTSPNRGADTFFPFKNIEPYTGTMRLGASKYSLTSFTMPNFGYNSLTIANLSLKDATLSLNDMSITANNTLDISDKDILSFKANGTGASSAVSFTYTLS